MHHRVRPMPPELRNLAAGELSSPRAPARFGLNSFKRPSYSYLQPRRGDGLRTYHFQILALCRPLVFERPPDILVFLNAARGAVLARGYLCARFQS